MFIFLGGPPGPSNTRDDKKERAFQAIATDIQPLARIFAERPCATVLHSGYQGQRCRWNVVFFHSTFDLE
jgi:hypothetical protein